MIRTGSWVLSGETARENDFSETADERTGIRGTISLNTPVDYFPFKVLLPQLDTIDCLYCLEPELELWRMKKEMGALDVKEEVLYRPFESLSRGEQTKILLALLFLRDNHFLLIDEPTNHLDGPSGNWWDSI